MRKNHSEHEQQNTATYQTGVTKTPRRSSGLVAFLLVLTIFLGGLASGLGILNIRLLLQLQQDSRPAAPVSTDPAASVPSTSFFPVEDAQLPALPKERKLILSYADGAAALNCTEVCEKNAEALVEILSSTTQKIVSAAGVVLSADGYILTNAHAVSSAQQIYVKLADGQQHRAALVGMDPMTDLAVLYIDAQGLTPAELGDSGLLQSFSVIYSAHSLQQERSLPLRSAMVLEPVYPIAFGKSDLKLIRMNVGSMDGPVYNIYGQLVGLHVGGMRELYGIRVDTELGYAMPTATIVEVARQLVEQGYVSGRPTLGTRTEPISRVYQQQLDVPGGLWVLKSAGNLQAGDILLALGGTPLGDNRDLYQILFREDIGNELTAVIYRNGQTLSVTLEILNTDG